MLNILLIGGKKMEAKIVELFGKNFSLTPERHSYLKVCNQFKQIANEAYNQYINDFNKSNHNLVDLVNNSIGQVINVFKFRKNS